MASSRNDTLIAAGGQLLQQALTVVTGILIARTLQSSGYGAVNVLRTIYSMAIILAPLGLDLALLKHAGRFQHPSPMFELVVSRLRGIVALANICVALLVGFALGGYLAHQVYPNIPGFQPMLLVTLAAVPIAADLAVLGAYYRGRHRPSIFSLATLYVQPVARVILVLLMIWAGPTPLAAVAITTIQVALSAVFLSAHLHGWRRKDLKETREDRAVMSAKAWRETRSILRESIWMAANMFVYGLIRLIDVLVLGAFALPRIVGEYAALSTVAQLIQVWPLAASQTLGPTVSRLYHEGDIDGIKRRLGEYLRLASIIGGFVFGGVAVFGDRLQYIFGHSFHFRTEIAFLMATGYLLSATLAPMGYALSMTGRHRAELVILALGGSALLVMCLVFVPQYGQIGAASSVAACFAAINIVRFAYVARVLGFIPGRLADFAPPLICLALAWAAKLAFEETFGANLLCTIAACAAYGAVYAVCVLLFLAPEARGLIGARLFRR